MHSSILFKKTSVLQAQKHSVFSNATVHMYDVSYERCAHTHSRQWVSYSDTEKCFSCHTVCHSNGFKRDFKGLGNTELSTKEYKRESMKTE